MGLLQLIIILVVVGVVLWAINAFVPMAASIKKILNIVVIVVVCLWLLSLFGVLPNINAIRVGR